MGKRLDAMLGRSFKTEKFRSLLNLTITRLGVLKNQRRARCSLTTKDVLELLQRGQSESALIRVEHVIKDQNMWDAFVLIEEFCHVLRERACLLENENSRVGELPELVEIRSIFTSRLGKEFTSAALELRGGSGVNVKMIQKMSTRHPSLDTKLQVLKEIAMENDIQLNLEGQLSEFPAGRLGLNRTQSGPSNYEDERDGRAKKVSAGDDGKLEEEDPLLAGSGREFADVASAAQAAFESAAEAAAAARAAVELSKAGNVGKGFDDHDRSNSGGKSSSFVDQNPGSEETELRNSSSDIIIKDSDSESDGVHGEEDQENSGKLNPKRIMGSSRLVSEKTPQEQCISTKKQDPIEQLTNDSQVTKNDGANDSRADPGDYEERSETGREHTQWPIWRLKRQTQGSIEKGLGQEETNKRWPERRFNFVSVRTTAGSRQ